MGRESSYHNGMRQDFASGCLISDPTYPSLEKSYRSILASWRAQKEAPGQIAKGLFCLIASGRDYTPPLGSCLSQAVLRVEQR